MKAATTARGRDTTPLTGSNVPVRAEAEDRADLMLRGLPVLGLVLVAVIGGALDRWIIKEVCAGSRCELPTEFAPGGAPAPWGLTPALEYSGAVFIYSLLGLALLAMAVLELRRAGFSMRAILAVAGVAVAAAVVTLGLFHFGALGDGIGSMAIVIVLCATLLVGVWRNLTDETPSMSRITALLSGLAAVMIAMAASPLLTDGALREKLLARTVYAAGGPGPHTNTSVWIAAGLAALVIAYQLVYAMAIPRPSRDLSPGQRTEALRALTLSVRTLLVGSSLFLVLGVIQVRAIHEWGVALAGSAAPPDAAATVAGLATISGVFYSMILVAIFAPPLLLLRRWAHALARERAVSARPRETDDDGAEAPLASPADDERRPTPADIERWLDDHRLNVGWPRATFTVFGMIAPFVVGGPGATILHGLVS